MLEGNGATSPTSSFLGCIFNSYGGENRASAKHPARARALGSTSSCRIGASAGSCSPERHRRGPETPPLHFQAKSCSFPGKEHRGVWFARCNWLEMGDPGSGEAERARRIPWAAGSRRGGQQPAKGAAAVGGAGNGPRVR
ncbi:hypothetical protein Y1Q_0012953 [Alligator mississippiensis]|uniref:Uncharacterized protein n=1 Tax=Alligator mississippiensis TaxID=8496 RepID=A0A151MZL3_ALLMI|nr:hypothetical protein Y1Q_0012953 [Alligator mississippiensis]